MSLSENLKFFMHVHYYYEYKFMNFDNDVDDLNLKCCWNVFDIIKYFDKIDFILK